MKHEEIIMLQEQCNKLLSDEIIYLTHDDPSLLKNSKKFFQILLDHSNDADGGEALFQLGLLHEKIASEVRELFYSKFGCPDSFRIFANTNNDMANKLFIHAADLGFLSAQLKAGNYFMEEKYNRDCRTYHVNRQKILEEDKKLAFFYFKLAADQGDFSAINIVMKLYLDGWGVEQSDEKAIEYLDKAKAKSSDSNNSFGKERDLVYQIEQRRRTLADEGCEDSLRHRDLMKNILEKLENNDASLTEIIFDDKKLNDADVLALQKALKQNLHLQKMVIKTHELTTKSLPILLEVLENNLNITEFGCALIPSFSIGSSLYYQAYRNILSARVEQKPVAYTSPSFSQSLK